MKILITAFEPFNNNLDNFSNIVLKKIEDNNNIIKETIPVLYDDSFLRVKELIEKHDPDVIILTGEARSYKSVAFEVIGINEYSKTPDNNNYIPTTKYIIKDGLDGIFSTLNYEIFEEVFKKNEVKFHRSFSAGTYICNSTLYKTLNYIKENDLKIKTGFIHIPVLTDDEVKALSKAINEYSNALINLK